MNHVYKSTTVLMLMDEVMKTAKNRGVEIIAGDNWALNFDRICKAKGKAKFPSTMNNLIKFRRKALKYSTEYVDLGKDTLDKMTEYVYGPGIAFDGKFPKSVRIKINIPATAKHIQYMIEDFISDADWPEELKKLFERSMKNTFDIMEKNGSGSSKDIFVKKALVSLEENMGNIAKGFFDEPHIGYRDRGDYFEFDNLLVGTVTPRYLHLYTQEQIAKAINEKKNKTRVRFFLRENTDKEDAINSMQDYEIAIKNNLMGQVEVYVFDLMKLSHQIDPDLHDMTFFDQQRVSQIRFEKLPIDGSSDTEMKARHFIYYSSYKEKTDALMEILRDPTMSLHPVVLDEENKPTYGTPLSEEEIELLIEKYLS